jgi:filamentous hemagglutinin family protein
MRGDSLRDSKAERLVLALLLSLGGWLSLSDWGMAQSVIVPDDTLGVERSNVIPNYRGLSTEVIDQGARRGQNLFHSFREFNISEGRSAYFFVDDASIQNVLARITGNNSSNILGQLGTFQRLANGQVAPVNSSLFLINPNGIIFGKDSRLDVGGSFVATTANAVQFPNSEFFSASIPTVPSSLLTVDPSALLYNAIVAQSPAIINRSTNGLQVRNGRSLFLLGGDVSLESGATLAFGGGAVELGGLAGVGKIGLESSGNALRLNFPADVSRGDVSLQSGRAIAYTGGSVAAYTRNLRLTDKSFIGTALQAQEGAEGQPAGDVRINITNLISVDNSFISSASLPGALGGSGNIQIQAQSVQMANQAGIVLFGEKDQGRITVNTSGEVAIDNSQIIAGTSQGVGENGDIAISAQTINISNLGGISSSSIRQGKTGNISLQAQDMINLRSGSDISSTSGALQVRPNNTEPGSVIQIRARTLTLSDPGTSITTGSLNEARAGDIQIVTDELVILDNDSNIDTGNAGNGNGGDVKLQTRSLLLLGGSQVQSLTSQQGNGGNVQINATEAITIRGFVDRGDSFNGVPVFIASGISTTNVGSGNAGNITINTGKLTLSEAGNIQTRAGIPSVLRDRNTPDFQDFGQSGKVTIQATESVDISGFIGVQDSGIDTSTNGNGNSGDLTIITGRFSLRDGASVQTSVQKDSSGNGGNLTLTATNSAEVIGKAYFSSSTSGDGKAGDITINTPRLSVRDGAVIVAGNDDSSGIGQGGNLTINAPDILEVTSDSMNARSVISTVTTNNTNAQRLRIQTGQLSLRGTGIISTRTFSGGRGGDLEVTANTIEVMGDRQNGTSLLDSSTEAGGAAGDLTINTQRLRVGDGGAISAATGPGSTGRGGNLIVTARDSVDITGRNNEDNSRLLVSSNGTEQAGNLIIRTPRLTLTDGGKVLAESSTVNGGSIDLNVSNLLLLRNGGQISATAGTANPQASGNGGNIDINSRFIVAIPKENSDITANATQGRGGKININTQGIFGLKQQLKLTPLSDITASSEVGLTGTIALNTPDNSTIQNSLTQLPNTNIDTNKLLAQTCLIRKDDPQGTFYITGTGSLPNRPNDLALSDYPTNTIQPTTRTAQRPWKLGDPIVEPQGFYKLADGRLVMSRECDRRPEVPRQPE